MMNINSNQKSDDELDFYVEVDAVGRVSFHTRQDESVCHEAFEDEQNYEGM